MEPRCTRSARLVRLGVLLIFGFQSAYAACPPKSQPDGNDGSNCSANSDCTGTGSICGSGGRCAPAEWQCPGTPTYGGGPAGTININQSNAGNWSLTLNSPFGGCSPASGSSSVGSGCGAGTYTLSAPGATSGDGQTGSICCGTIINWSVTFPAATTTTTVGATTTTTVSATTTTTVGATTTTVGATTTTTVPVTPVLKTITVTPNNISVAIATNLTFTPHGFDQFGKPIALGPVSWSASIGTIGSSGIFRSASLGKGIIITATSGGVSGSATVNVINADTASTYAYPVPYKPSVNPNGITFTGLPTVPSTIKVYTIMGELVRTLTTDGSSATLPWDVKNADGAPVASGVYLYQIKNDTSEKRGTLGIIR